jgi:hypothetical protein
MKTLKYIAFTLLCVLGMSSCNNNDDNAAGNPVITPSTVGTSAQFGDSLNFKINVTDGGNIPLSTLKAYLYYGNELVSTTTIRTKTYGDYSGKIYIPYYKNIPNGNASLKFVLQNIHFTKTEKDYSVALTRPQYSSLKLITSDGNNYTMTPSQSNPYLFSVTVPSTTNKVKGYIVAPSADTNGNQITFGADNSSSDVVQNSTNYISFINSSAGNITITFNTYTYEYTPLFIPTFNGTAMTYSADGIYTYYGTLTQGQKYAVGGADAFSSSSWFNDPDFFTKNSDGTLTFNAITGLYQVTANFSLNYFQVYAMTNSTTTASLQSNGSGALWIIGDGNIGKPSYASNGINWSTGNALCMAQVSAGVYQATLVAGQQLSASSINFKFFHQNNWGNEFDGLSTSSYVITTTSNLVYIGDGTNGGDNGNIYLIPGVTLQSGATYVLTVDCSKGISAATLNVTKK